MYLRSEQEIATKFAGRYQLVKFEKVREFYLASGLPEDLAVQSESDWPKILEIVVTGNTLMFSSSRPLQPIQWSKFVLNEEVTVTTPGYVVCTSRATIINGGKLVIDMTHHVQEMKSLNLVQNENRIYQVSGDFMMGTISAAGVGIIIECLYKRL